MAEQTDIARRRIQRRGDIRGEELDEEARELNRKIRNMYGAVVVATRYSDHASRYVRGVGEDNERAEMSGGRFLRAADSTVEFLLQEYGSGLGN
jgi:hypothetical protein